MLMILDGFGISPNKEGNAVAAAINQIMIDYLINIHTLNYKLQD